MVKKPDIKDKQMLPVKEYVDILKQISHQIENSQVEALTSLNILLNKRNWQIGKLITEKQNELDLGPGFISQLAKDIQNLYPDYKGFSQTNLFRVRRFYEAFQDFPTAVGKLKDLPIFKIPWGHNTLLLEKLKDNDQRIWYAQKAYQEGWSRSTLETQIKRDLFNREGHEITNFKKNLPSSHSAIVQESLKDPYIFDFLKLNDDHLEYELEQGLIDNVQKLLLELGDGFAFVARQYKFEVSGQDFYIDLLFYNYKLKCFVVIELKAREFEPKDAGQLNFYLSAIDDILRKSDDNPTIGLIICKTKNDFLAEYALRDINKPIGISGYETELIKKLPKELKNTLPTIEQIEAGLEKKELLEQNKVNNKLKK